MIIIIKKFNVDESKSRLFIKIKVGKPYLKYITKELYVKNVIDEMEKIRLLPILYVNKVWTVF